MNNEDDDNVVELHARVKVEAGGKDDQGEGEDDQGEGDDDQGEGDDDDDYRDVVEALFAEGDAASRFAYEHCRGVWEDLSRRNAQPDKSAYSQVDKWPRKDLVALAKATNDLFGTIEALDLTLKFTRIDGKLTIVRVK